MNLAGKALAMPADVVEAGDAEVAAGTVHREGVLGAREVAAQEFHGVVEDVRAQRQAHGRHEDLEKSVEVAVLHAGEYHRIVEALHDRLITEPAQKRGSQGYCGAAVEPADGADTQVAAGRRVVARRRQGGGEQGGQQQAPGRRAGLHALAHRGVSRASRPVASSST
ncbi:MAG: hypothetical protein M5U09_17900 [Gammaproteobacteria bacterium]|nr:hypothetical protein [Gammaproteobacteria bacterium]